MINYDAFLQIQYDDDYRLFFLYFLLKNKKSVVLKKYEFINNNNAVNVPILYIAIDQINYSTKPVHSHANIPVSSKQHMPFPF